MPFGHLLIIGIHFEDYLPEDLYLCNEIEERQKND
jgi:hypothetical protein